MKTTILFWTALVALLLLCGCNETANNVDETSRGEISETVSAEKDISGNEEVSREPDESEKANVSDGGASENTDGSSEGDASATEEVFEIDGC